MLQPLVILTLLAGPGLPAAPATATAAPARLEAALRACDDGALQRLGRQMAAAGLTPLLDPAGPRAPRLAAIAAAPSAPDAPLLLGDLLRIAARPDRRAAASAARAAARIAGNLTDSRARELDLAAADLVRWGEAWMSLALQPGVWTDVRVHGLEVAAALAAVLPEDTPSPFDLGRALADAEPQVRRAALELVPIPVPPALGDAVVERAGDDDDSVALAAAQALCAAIPLADEPDDAATAAVTRLAGHRDRVLAALDNDEPNTDVLPGAALDVARCLAADPGRDAGDALRRLARRLPAAARPALARLLAERQRRGLP